MKITDAVEQQAKLSKAGFPVSEFLILEIGSATHFLSIKEANIHEGKAAIKVEITKTDRPEPKPRKTKSKK